MTEKRLCEDKIRGREFKNKRGRGKIVIKGREKERSRRI